MLSMTRKKMLLSMTGVEVLSMTGEGVLQDNMGGEEPTVTNGRAFER